MSVIYIYILYILDTHCRILETMQRALVSNLSAPWYGDIHCLNRATYSYESFGQSVRINDENLVVGITWTIANGYAKYSSLRQKIDRSIKVCDTVAIGIKFSSIRFTKKRVMDITTSGIYR